MDYFFLPTNEWVKHIFIPFILTIIKYLTFCHFQLVLFQYSNILSSIRYLSIKAN